MTKATLARLSYTSAVRLVRLQPSARAHADAGRRLLTSYNVLGSQPAQSKGLFGPVALSGQRALLARYRSHTLSDFRFFVPLFALSLHITTAAPQPWKYIISFYGLLSVRYIQLVYRLLLIAITYGAPSLRLNSLTAH